MQGIARLGVLAAFAGVLCLPASAAQQCDLPKGYYTAEAQYEYSVNTELGIWGTRAQQYLPAPGSEIDVNHLIETAPYTAQGLAAATVESASYLGLATYNFSTAAANAFANEPPTCVATVAAPRK